MTRTQRQLTAIRYSYQEKIHNDYLMQMDRLGINLIFNWQKHYKSIGGFVRAYGSDLFNSVVKDTLFELQKRYIRLINTPNCHKDTKLATFNAIQQCHIYLNNQEETR